MTIAEDFAGFPTLCLPTAIGGLGFDYRLALGNPHLCEASVAPLALPPVLLTLRFTQGSTFSTDTRKAVTGRSGASSPRSAIAGRSSARRASASLRAVRPPSTAVALVPRSALLTLSYTALQMTSASKAARRRPSGCLTPTSTTT